MKITFSELLQVIMKREGVNVPQMAEKLGMSRQAMHHKLTKGSFTESDMIKYSDALGYDIDIELSKREETE